jgi:hypothetical protein
MTDYGRKLEKEYRDGMVVGAIYNFLGKGTDGWKYRYELIGFDGCGEDLLLIFKSIKDDTVFRIMANDMGGFSLISRPIEEEKEETDMTDYGKRLEKYWRNKMVVGHEYDIIREGSDSWILNLTLLCFHGHGMDFTLTFKHENCPQLNVKASEINWVHPHSVPCSDTVPKPMQLVKKIEGYRFDEEAFYRATNHVRHFLIKNLDNNNRYEAFYYGPTLDNTGMHITFARIVGCGNVTCESAELYHDKIKCDPIMTNFKLFKGDSICTYEEIKIDDIFNREEKLEWDIDKLKVGKAYHIRDIAGIEIDGIYTGLYNPTTPDDISSIVFTIISDERTAGIYHVYKEKLVSGKIKIYELTCGGENE